MPISHVGMDGTDPMKIEHPRVNETETVGTKAGRTPAKVTTGVGTDAVRLSSDLQLAEQAVRAAAPDADRSDVVSRARALLDQGTLGSDVETLADRMIDALIHS